MFEAVTVLGALLAFCLVVFTAAGLVAVWMVSPPRLRRWRARTAGSPRRHRGSD